MRVVCRQAVVGQQAAKAASSPARVFIGRHLTCQRDAEAEPVQRAQRFERLAKAAGTAAGVMPGLVRVIDADAE